MCAQQSSNTYFSQPEGYDNFMGRYSRPLANEFIATVPLKKGDRVLDLGCGPGALTGALVEVLGVDAVLGVDPSPPFIEAYRQRFPGVTGKVGSAEDIPFEDHAFDAVMSQLVIHFVVDLDAAGREMMRVSKPGGWIATCTWIFNQMDLLYIFDEAAKTVTGGPPPSPPAHMFREDGSIGAYFSSIGLTDISETTLRVSTTYERFDDLWNTYLAGIGPTGAWMKGQPDDVKAAMQGEIRRVLGEPEGEVILNAAARSARGRVPV